MFNKKKIFDLYNQISDRKLSEDELKCILPKLYLITNKIPMDEVEIIEIIDVLQEIKKYDHMGNITPEIVDLILKITNNNQLSMENTLYFKQKNLSSNITWQNHNYFLNKCSILPKIKTTDYSVVSLFSSFLGLITT